MSLNPDIPQRSPSADQGKHRCAGGRGSQTDGTSDSNRLFGGRLSLLSPRNSHPLTSRNSNGSGPHTRPEAHSSSWPHGQCRAHHAGRLPERVTFTASLRLSPLPSPSPTPLFVSLVPGWSSPGLVLAGSTRFSGKCFSSCLFSQQ